MRLGYRQRVTIVQTVLVYVAVPAAVLALFAALTMWPKAQRNPRYRCGEAWEYPPVWWSANPDGLREHVDDASQRLGAHALGAHGLGAHSSSEPHPSAADEPAVAGLVGGGARGTW